MRITWRPTLLRARVVPEKSVDRSRDLASLKTNPGRRRFEYGHAGMPLEDCLIQLRRTPPELNAAGRDRSAIAPTVAGGYAVPLGPSSAENVRRAQALHAQPESLVHLMLELPAV